MAGPTFAGGATTALPDAFVGVPYLAGLPVTYAASGTITACSIVSAFANGNVTLTPSNAGTLTFNSAGLVSGTIQVASSTSTQVDGPYTANIKVTDAQGGTQTGNLTINVHYLPAATDADLSVAAQAAIRAGEQVDSSQTLVGGVATNVFPTGPAMPTDIG